MNRTLRQARTVFVVSIASVLLPLVIVGWIDPPGKLLVLAFPVSLIGLVSPVIGYRLYLLSRERRRGFVRTGIFALAVTEGVALLGVVGYALSGRLSTLSGVLTHVLLVGAIWPTPERLESFREFWMGLVDRPIFLVGFMAAGKTTVGRALARRLDVDFIDTDEQLERREQRSVASIFENSGEGYFRDREWEALQSMSAGTSCVVATGGGAFLGSAARRWMKSRGLTVWLDVGLDEARRRVPEGADRPLWTGRERLELRVLYERRRAVYALAHFRVAASPGGPREVAERIQARTEPFFR